MYNYFLKITHENKTANKLEEAVLRHFKRYDRSIIDENGLNGWQSVTADDIELISEKYPRCNPRCVKLNWVKGLADDNNLYVGDFIGITFYRIENLGDLKKEVKNEKW